MKHVGKISTVVLLLSALVFAAAWLCVPTLPTASAAAGLAIGENKIPIARDKASAAYAVFQAWVSGSNTGKCFDAADGTLKTGATYANCAVRAEQDAVTAIWWLQVPATLPSGSYLVIPRDGADGAETSADAAAGGMFVITWSRELGQLKTVDPDILVSY